jgi:methylisocitrate lyase
MVSMLVPVCFDNAPMAIRRKLHVPGDPLVLSNIWDPGSAKAVAEAGAMALATSSWAVSEASGYSDGEHTPLTFAIDNLRGITEATELPVTVDVESGYGDTPTKVGETIALAIKAGAIGCNLEDSFPDNGSLRETKAPGRSDTTCSPKGR